MTTFVYVGTFTGGVLGGEAEGISVFTFDEGAGSLAHVQTVGGLTSPSYLARHPTLPMLYVVEREWSTDERHVGALATFAIDPRDGRLEQAGRIHTGGDWPAHVSVHPSGRLAFVANPRDACVAVFRIGDDGLPQSATWIVRHMGRGPTARQESPYPHSAWPDMTGRYLLACDLGVDRVMIYRVDEASGQLTPTDFPYAQVSSGAGARHLAFHPSNRFVYVLNELDSTVSVFQLDAESGLLTIVQTVDTLPSDYDGRRSAAHVLVHPSGGFLYASSRGHDSIALYEVNQTNGRLRFVAHYPTQGRTPRNFNLSPSGEWMLVANQHGNSIHPFRVRDGGGRLESTGSLVSTPSPVCLVFYVAA
jgi:6-phosphogluconolactonase